MDTNEIVKESGKTFRKLSNVPLLVAFLAMWIIPIYFFEKIGDKIDSLTSSLSEMNKQMVIQNELTRQIIDDIKRGNNRED